MELIRLQKYLSQAGICSRRKGEEYISQGLVYVNGQVATIGQSINPEVDKVELKDKIVEDRKKMLYYKINKPRGVITTCAQKGETAIVDIMDVKERIFPIGRLDKDSTGLIIMTNDGRLANYLMHPKYEHEKEYLVKVYGTIDDESLEKMSKGVFILGKMTKDCIIERVSSGTFKVYLKEGRNRQIRRMVQLVGHEVKLLKRLRVENIELGNLEEGEYKHLSQKEINGLKTILGIS